MAGGSFTCLTNQTFCPLSCGSDRVSLFERNKHFEQNVHFQLDRDCNRKRLRGQSF